MRWLSWILVLALGFAMGVSITVRYLGWRLFDVGVVIRDGQTFFEDPFIPVKVFFAVAFIGVAVLWLVYWVYTSRK